MTIYYLYVKTHNKTGLKYLGFTKQSDPHKYTGSGTYWKSHLEVHGYDYSTDIIQECQSKDEVKGWGSYYSKLWNIVDARDSQGKKIWANLTEENGYGGDTVSVWTEEMRKAISQRQKGRISPWKGMTYEEIHGQEKAIEKIEKFKETFKKKAESKPPKEKLKRLPYGKDRVGMTYEEIYGEEKALEIKSKHSANMLGENNPRYGKPGTFKGKTHTEEALLKMRQPTGAHKNPRQILTCPHCKKASDASNAKRWHFNNCKFKT